MLMRYCELVVKVSVTEGHSLLEWDGIFVIDVLRQLLDRVERGDAASMSNPAVSALPQLQRLALTMCVAVNAHLQGLNQRGALLLEAAAFFGKGGSWSLCVAEQLLERALPTEEIQSLIGPTCPTSVPEIWKPLVRKLSEACAARVEALLARRSHTYDSAAKDTTAVQQQLQSLYHSSFVWCTQRVTVLEKAADQRARIVAKDSKTMADLLRQANWACRAGVRYQQAAKTLELGHSLTSQYWKPALECFSRVTPTPVFPRSNVLAEVAAHRCVRAATVLSAGTDADAARSCYSQLR
jgi:hypothetical protein